MPPGIHRLTPERLPDFWRLHERGTAPDGSGGGWCFCAAWWVPTWEGWGERSADENRAVREACFARGELDGFLYYDAAGEPRAWAQVGPRDRLVKLCGQLALPPSPPPPIPPIWAITCFFVDPAVRRTGVARALLDGVLAELRAAGVRRVEAFPKRQEADEAGLWNGPEAMYAAVGFTVAREDPRRPVLALDL